MTVVAVDIGGSSTRIAGGGLSVTQSPKRISPKSVADLIEEISKTATRPSAIGLSVPGMVRSADGYVTECQTHPFLEGPLRDEVGQAFGCPVALLNDGVAHAEAVRLTSNIAHGAATISLGTGVGFGVTGPHGEMILNASGDPGWGLGNFWLDEQDTDGFSSRKAHWVCGKHGLAEAQRLFGARQWEEYSWRVGLLARFSVMLFQPKSVILSGGIAHAAPTTLVENVQNCINEHAGDLLTPEVSLSPFPEAGMAGAWAVAKAMLEKN